MHHFTPLCIALVLVFAAAPPVEAQEPRSAIPQLKSTKGVIEATPLNARPIAKLEFGPEALEGLEVITADAKPLGRVSEVKVKDGRIASIEVEAGGFLGYFATTYEIPANWLVKKANRVELLLGSDVTFQFER